jgi:hypothetical protein
MNLLKLIGRTRHPAAPTSPYFYVPGPVFTQPAEAAIFHTTLAQPPQRLLGGGYPVAMQFRSLQDAPLFSQDAVPITGLGGLQAGQYALPPMTDNTQGEFDDAGAAYVEAN